MSDSEAQEVLRFWFGELNNGFSDDAHRKRWFSGGATFDNEIRAKFSILADNAADGDLDDQLAAPNTRLAYILLHDQFPRNLHRGNARAFACDDAALNAARTGIQAGMDQTLTIDERAFFYLPFEHSESIVDAHTCVGLFSQLKDQTPKGDKHLTGNYLRFAHQHRDILMRFGRFPHRNTVLGRESTPHEVTFLDQGNSFGQSPGGNSTP